MREGDGISMKRLFSWLVWPLRYDKRLSTPDRNPEPELEPCLPARTLGDVLDVFAEALLSAAAHIRPRHFKQSSNMKPLGSGPHERAPQNPLRIPPSISSSFIFLTVHRIDLDLERPFRLR